MRDRIGSCLSSSVTEWFLIQNTVLTWEQCALGITHLHCFFGKQQDVEACHSSSCQRWTGQDALRRMAFTMLLKGN